MFLFSIFHVTHKKEEIQIILSLNLIFNRNHDFNDNKINCNNGMIILSSYELEQLVKVEIIFFKTPKNISF